MTGAIGAFVVVALLLVGLTLAVLLWPLLRGGQAPPADDSAQSNLRILRAQLRELDDEFAAGSLDAPQHAAARAELERRVLDEAGGEMTPPRAAPGRKSALVLVLALPLLAAALYARLGNRDALDPAQAAAAAAVGPVTAADIEAALPVLIERLKTEPDNVDGWVLLGRSYARLERFDAARDAFAQAVQRRADDPDLLVDYADAMARAQDRKLAGEPEKLLRRALALDPDHGKALALAGAAAMARQDHDAALAHWMRLRARLPPDTPMLQGLDLAIDRARAAKGLSPLAAAPGAAEGANGAALRVTVTLAPELAARVQPGDTLFVFARAADGPRMPLAVSRQALPSAPTQPIVVQLDDSLAMTPQARLSAADRVIVGARVSRAGSAVPAGGDFEAESAPMAPRGEARLLIDRVRP